MKYHLLNHQVERREQLLLQLVLVLQGELGVYAHAQVFLYESNYSARTFSIYLVLAHPVSSFRFIIQIQVLAVQVNFTQGRVQDELLGSQAKRSYGLGLYRSPYDPFARSVY